MGRLKNSDLHKILYGIIALIAIGEAISGNFSYLIFAILTFISLTIMITISTFIKTPKYDFIFAIILTIIVLFIIFETS